MLKISIESEMSFYDLNVMDGTVIPKYNDGRITIIPIKKNMPAVANIENPISICTAYGEMLVVNADDLVRAINICKVSSNYARVGLEFAKEEEMEEERNVAASDE